MPNSEMRKRARLRFNEWCRDGRDGLFSDLMADFATLERREAIEECAKIVDDGGFHDCSWKYTKNELMAKIRALAAPEKEETSG